MSDFQMALVHTLRYEAKGVISIELTPMEGTSFVPFEAGAYVDLYLPNDLMRSYSLLNSPDDKDRYVLGVLNDHQSRGGSAYIHQAMRVGETIKISQPKYNFRLNLKATHTVLVAGGIGIIPLYCMMQQLIKLGRSVELIYYPRSRQEASFLAELEKLNIKVTIRYVNKAVDPLKLDEYLAGFSSDTHFYCCGSIILLKAFADACDFHHYNPNNTHTELFSVTDLFAGEGDEVHNYHVVLAKSTKVLEVVVGKTLIETLVENGVNVNLGCGEGICGSCRTKVLDGIPDHKDGVLTQEEQKSNKEMMVCVSGCKSNALVLDL